MSCNDGSITKKPAKAITWTLEQVGGIDFMADTTDIRITFNKSIGELTVNGENLNNFIDVTGAGERNGWIVRESGTSWLIPIDVFSAGSAMVTVESNNRNIEDTSKPLVLFKENEFAPITWTVSANGDVRRSTDKLTFTFYGDIVGEFALTSGMMLIEPDSSADLRDRGNVTLGIVSKSPVASGFVYEAAVNTSSSGWISISLDMLGVDTYPQRVRVIRGTDDMFQPPKAGETGDRTLLIDEVEREFTYTVITIDTKTDFPDFPPNEEFGIGNIVGDGLARIRAAAAKNGSFLQLYIDVSEVRPDEVGHGKIAVGNILVRDEGSQEELMNNNFQLQPMQGVPVGPGVVTVNVPLFEKLVPDYLRPTDTQLYITCWDNVIIYAAVVFDIKTAIPINRPARAKRDITILGTAGQVGGAGAFFTYFDQIAVEQTAPENAWIEFYVRGTGGGTWGSTGYHWTVGNPGCINLTQTNLVNDPAWGRYCKIDITVFRAAKLVGNLDRPTLNPYAGSAFEKVWLCREDE
jgi:hypothetical protein